MGQQENVAVATSRPGGVGVLFRGRRGAPKPANAFANLDMTKYWDQGFVGETGIVISRSRDVQKKKSLGGAVVKTMQTDFTCTYKIVLLEDRNANVLRTIAGDDNVIVDQEGFPIRVKHRKDPLPVCTWVVDTIDDQGALGRDFIELGQITTIGDVTRVHTDTVQYEITIEVFENSEGLYVDEMRDPGAISSGVPIIRTLDPASVPLGGGLIAVEGSGFGGATGVTIDGAAAVFKILSSGWIVVTAPADTAGDVELIVTNTSGPSAPATLTYE
ncbi:hypothetical protein GS462_11240 [Rhodococcus hoagii]|nr:hypothetical protein [Prescottella equi]MBM4650986.1 hypothetical protein [Prescottella equi]MBM4686667.1 hypothetical protein [Prescottella equi]